MTLSSCVNSFSKLFSAEPFWERLCCASVVCGTVVLPVGGTVGVNDTSEAVGKNQSPDPSIAAVELCQAKEAFRRASSHYKEKLIGEAAFQEAKFKLDLLKARLKGDPAETARITLEFAVQKLNRISALQSQNLVSVYEVKKAKDRIELLKAELAADQSAVSRLQLLQAKEEFERVGKLYEQKLVSEREYQQAKGAFELLQAAQHENSERRFVRIFVGRNSLTFEGTPTT